MDSWSQKNQSKSTSFYGIEQFFDSAYHAQIPALFVSSIWCFDLAIIGMDSFFEERWALESRNNLSYFIPQNTYIIWLVYQKLAVFHALLAIKTDYSNGNN